MTNCLNCNAELVHTEGRRPKTFCSDACRGQYWRDKKPKEHKTKVLKLDEYEALMAKIENSERNLGEIKKLPLTGKSVEITITEKDHFKFKPIKVLEQKMPIGSVIEYSATDNSEIQKQIEAVKAEIRPSVIDKSKFEKYQEKKIAELEKKLK